MLFEAVKSSRSVRQLKYVQLCCGNVQMLICFSENPTILPVYTGHLTVEAKLEQNRRRGCRLSCCGAEGKQFTSTHLVSESSRWIVAHTFLQLGRKCNWRCWSCCACRCSACEQDAHDSAVSLVHIPRFSPLNPLSS